jgi:hypothetical protein
VLIAAGDNPDRFRNEASFAALCGASPIEASSGKTHRHRLNRGGDRQANAALHRIAITRPRCDRRTRDYVDRRIREGKTVAKPSAASSATSPARSRTSSDQQKHLPPPPRKPHPSPVDEHRGISAFAPDTSQTSSDRHTPALGNKVTIEPAAV